jgi:hypothetical protein
MILVENLPHVCGITRGETGNYFNCGIDHVEDYGYFIMDYPNPRLENYREIIMQYGFKYYKIKIHSCYRRGSYCEIRNILNNILEYYFKVPSYIGCVKEWNHFRKDDWNYEKHQDYNSKVLFERGFNEHIGYGYSFNWRVPELMKLDFSKYILPDELKLKDDPFLIRHSVHLSELRLLFGEHAEDFNKEKIKIGLKLIKQRLKTYEPSRSTFRSSM